MNEVIYSVSELNLMIKSLLEGDRTFTNIQIQGEISNFKRYSSGHCYFTLKDAGGVLKAVMFRNQARSLRFEPQNGDTVVAIGRVGVYERDGVYQLYTDLLLPLGAGDLMLAYEELKKKLTEEGLFDSERKRELPLNPKTVGMITSPSGAAVRDMITVARRRNRGIKAVAPFKISGIRFFIYRDCFPRGFFFINLKKLLYEQRHTPTVNSNMAQTNSGSTQRTPEQYEDTQRP